PNLKQNQNDVQKAIDDTVSFIDISKLRSVLEANPNLKQGLEDPQKLIAEAFASLDWSKVRSAMQTRALDAFAQIKARKAHSADRLNSADRSIQLDELCRLYARDDWYWHDKAEQLGVSEDELAKEAEKRGLHLQFDLDKSWDQLHALLTGISLRERAD